MTVGENGSISEKAYLHHESTIGMKSRWTGGEFTQAYWQLEDPAEPGIYTGYTCNAEFDKARGYAILREVRNYRGPQTLKSGGPDKNYARKWNAIALDDEVFGETAAFSLVEGDDALFRSICD